MKSASVPPPSPRVDRARADALSPSFGALPSDEELKAQVRGFWNAQPCGTQFTGLSWGTSAFFAQVEAYRYASHPWLPELGEFDRFGDRDVLEVGCGLGTDLIQFARAGARVTGIDLTPASIEIVKRRFAQEGLAVRAQVADAERLPFDDASFDAVYSFGVLHHTPDTERAIGEVHRVLRPGGRLIVMLYHRRSLRVWLGTPVHALRQLRAGRLPGADVVHDWIRVYDGADNPLGKAYTRAEMDAMFRRFRERTYQVSHPVRLGAPGWANAISQRLIAPRLGFFLTVKAYK